MTMQNIIYKTHQTRLGEITMASDGTNLVGLWFEGQKHFGEFGKGLNPQNNSIAIKDSNQSEHEVFLRTINWLNEYFLGQNPKVTDLKMRLEGSDFQKKVWEELLKIPYGSTISYGEIAKKLSAENIKTCGRAVGNAVARNPISIIIPCHRVIAKNNALTGYAGGVQRKHDLLLHEGVRI